MQYIDEKCNIDILCQNWHTICAFQHDFKLKYMAHIWIGGRLKRVERVTEREYMKQ